LRAVIPALGFGNAVVLKPDQQTAVASGVLVAKLFSDAGVPENVLHVLPGDAEPGKALTTDPHVAMIAFTGSSAVGRTIGAAAGAALKRVSLELGGNSPFIVLADADIEGAARCGAWGSFLHQGQICMASSRHLVHESIAAEYAVALGKHADGLAVGDPASGTVHLGPIINDTQVARVDRRRRDARLGRHARTEILSTDGARGRKARHGRVRRRDLRAGRTDHDVRDRRGSDRACE
jgi:benzaldehyde dehydrogenase (NAD)